MATTYFLSANLLVTCLYLDESDADTFVVVTAAASVLAILTIHSMYPLHHEMMHDFIGSCIVMFFINDNVHSFIHSCMHELHMYNAINSSFRRPARQRDITAIKFYCGYATLSG